MSRLAAGVRGRGRALRVPAGHRPACGYIDVAWGDGQSERSPAPDQTARLTGSWLSARSSQTQDTEETAEAKQSPIDQLRHTVRGKKKNFFLLFFFFSFNFSEKKMGRCGAAFIT